RAGLARVRGRWSRVGPVHGHLDLERHGARRAGLAEPDLVAALQVVLGEDRLAALLLRLAPADAPPVDERAELAAQVADAAVRRVDVEQAVQPGDRGVLLHVGQLDVAIAVPADDARGPLVEDVVFLRERSAQEAEGDRGGHGRFLIGRVVGASYPGYAPAAL